MSSPTGPVGIIPPPPGVIPDFENPQDAGLWADRVCLVTCTVLISVFFFFRCYVKAFYSSRILLEDVTSLLAWILMTAYLIAILMMTRNGQGHHGWEVTPDQYSRLRFWLYIRTMLYGPAAFFVRATILLLIARVFAARRYAAKSIHLYIWVLLISIIPIQIMKIMICLPIHAFWDLNVSHALCMEQRRIFVVDRSIAIISDALILVAPVALSWSLEISLQKKLKIASLLGAGGIAIGITCFQMTKLVGFQTSTDPTADMVVLDVTTTSELTIGVLCACLPAVNFLLEKYLFLSHPVHKGNRPKGRWSKLVRRNRGLSGSSTLVGSKRNTCDGVSLLDFDVEMAMLTGKPIRAPTRNDLGKEGNDEYIWTAGSADGMREGWLAPGKRAEDDPVEILVPDRIWDGLKRDGLSYVAPAPKK